jgi:hypothetical protein
MEMHIKSGVVPCLSYGLRLRCIRFLLYISSCQYGQVKSLPPNRPHPLWRRAAACGGYARQQSTRRRRAAAPGARRGRDGRRRLRSQSEGGSVPMQHVPGMANRHLFYPFLRAYVVQPTGLRRRPSQLIRCGSCPGSAAVRDVPWLWGQASRVMCRIHWHCRRVQWYAVCALVPVVVSRNQKLIFTFYS